MGGGRSSTFSSAVTKFAFVRSLRKAAWYYAWIIVFIAFVHGRKTEASSLRFTKRSYNATVGENSPGKTYVRGEEKMGIFCADPSFEIRYKLAGGSNKDGYFKVSEMLTGDFWFLLISLRPDRHDVLNRESCDKYTLKVKAIVIDRTTRKQLSNDTQTTVFVTVTDTNDLGPIFLSSEYETTIAEDTPLYTSILNVTAEDADLGINGEVYYRFAEMTEQFGIHPTTGVISLTRPLRYTDKSVHELSVVAKDRGTASAKSYSMPNVARVRIRVKQANLYGPEIYVNPLPKVIEQSTANIYAIVRLTDRDTGVHGEIDRLEIVDGDPDGHFRVRPTHTVREDGAGAAPKKNEYNIEVLRLLDRESAPHGYNLTLRARDKGVPPRETFKSIAVQLTDVNDNAPVFDREEYEAYVPETAPINTPVVKVKVTDADAGKNAEVLLEIVGGNEGKEFRINSDTGMLYTAAPLDAEMKSYYTLTVSALDQGSVGSRKQTAAKIKVNVKDANDNDPIFVKAEDEATVNENEPAGTIVARVIARDRDSGENSYISYSIANLNPVPFEIDHFAGIVKTTQVLDYETMRRHYTLKIRASDWGLPYRRQTEMQLRVKVRPVNDNRPQFQKVDCVGHIPRNVKIGHEIFTLSAIDFDASNAITYRIVSGNEDGCFILDANVGTISIACDLNDVASHIRELNVTATDSTHFSDTARLRINLISATKYAEDVGKLLLNEAGGGFECRDTGVLRRQTEILAMSKKNNVPVELKEEFGMTPIRYGENVHAPELIAFPTEIRVNESAPLGFTVASVKARDRDLGYNGKLVYGISSGDDDSVFRIEPDTGEIRLIGYLDRERRGQYDLNVTVYDLGKPQKSVSRGMTVIVLDVNDNAPKFERTLVTLRIPENTANGTAVYRFNATDADEGENADVTYRIVYESREFAVNATSGVLHIIAPLDRERQNFYEFMVRATDGASELFSLHSDALVRLTVEDVNDNAPNFSLPQYSVRAREDVPVGTVIAILTATDPDSEDGGEIRYSLTAEEDTAELFAIDSLTGTVRLAKSLNFEDRQVHTLTVKANDQGAPPLSSDTKLIVEVIDVNENLHAPTFDNLAMAFSVLENQPAGTLVAQVKATDADAKGDDSRVAYTIREGDGLGYFSIDNSGNIRTLTTLDAETKTSYWLTIFAQDYAVVPLHSILYVYIKVLNVNDNVPLTSEPVYYPHINERISSITPLVQLSADDKDLETNRSVIYKITGGNGDNLFVINSSTGLIETTGRKFDREKHEDHVLEVLVSDNGSPTALNSTTKVVVIIDDANDNAPKFGKRFYSFKIRETKNRKLSSIQQTTSSENDSRIPELYTWESFKAENITGDALFRIVAKDDDIEENAALHYSMKSSRRGIFSIHPENGIVYSDAVFTEGDEYSFDIRATDGGIPSKSSDEISVHVMVIKVPDESPHPPSVKQTNQRVDVTESDPVGFLVMWIQATDEDGDHLWYYLESGDTRAEFTIEDAGNVVLVKKLNADTQKFYNLTVRITDGVHNVYTQVYVNVVAMNKYRPVFNRKIFLANVSESTPVGTKILQLNATDEDRDQSLDYSIHNAQSVSSLKIFNLDHETGALTVVESLDRESIAQHVLTVMVKDDGLPGKRNYARVVIDVFDANDHAPEFSIGIMQGRVFETATVGTTVVQVFAIDKDHGENAAIVYHIASGNIGNAFSIDETLGTLQVAKELDINSMHSEYLLMVKASDCGKPSLSASLTVHIMVVMADNAPPRFNKLEVSSEIFENEPPGTVIKYLEARSTSSLMFEITDGNEEDTFEVNPSTGIVVTKRALDYENTKIYNLSITATNMAGAKARCYVVVHVLDRNDNVPEFIEIDYKGYISEAATVGSFVLNVDNLPLTLKARDDDSALNALLQYEIVEATSKRIFYVVANTGVIRTVVNLDYETASELDFHVRVSDLGKPRLTSETVAHVRISVNDVNDCVPIFSQNEYNATVIVPTYNDVTVVQLNATDRDSKNLTKLRYAIADGNNGNTYAIVSDSGLITVQDSITGFRTSPHRLKVTVTDGLFTSESFVNIKWEKSEDSGLVFQKSLYNAVVQENMTKSVNVVVVNVIGSVLNENLIFTILNPTEYFTIGKTSGAIRTTGRPFDRETQEYHQLIVQARSEDSDSDNVRIAHVPINITVLDENDNSPMFVNLPYYAVVSIEAEKGTAITKVHAVDLDKGENGEVRYELIKGHGELFKVDRKSGEVSLRQMLEGNSKEYQLIIAAYDGGMSPRSTEVTLNVKVIDKSMPIFEKQFYSLNVAENVDVNSHLSVLIRAESPTSRKLIYSISNGNTLEQFAVDFNTGMLYVTDSLDYEEIKEYTLTVRATDSLSGIFAEVLVNVLVTDVNDCPPEFQTNSYNVTISEAASFGSFVLKVKANDNDTGTNNIVRYSIENDIYNSTDLFYINAEDGSVYLKQSLDHETRVRHHFIVVANDTGIPSLSTTANVWLNVIDVNDNAPKFEKTIYGGTLSEDATRGQFVTVITASDADTIDRDRLVYNIVGGNQLQNFALNSSTGIITLNNLQKLADSSFHWLNVSVTDGVYTSFAKVRVEIASSNLHSPVFEKTQYEATVAENQAAGATVTRVHASDVDQGMYGQLSYALVSNLMSEKFRIDNATGEITTNRMLDREDVELYEMMVRATDAGGRFGLATVRVKVADINDNAPQFLLNEYKACIHVGLVTNSFFLKVKAIDDDKDASAQVEYSIYETEANGIRDLFGINTYSGSIHLLKSAKSFGNQAFQFFVRATDKGTPAMYSDVSVDVYVMTQKDQPPVFEKSNDKYMISEDSTIGSTIAQMKLVNNVTAQYKIVSDSSLFSIDNDGRIALTGRLDREKVAYHLIVVSAFTDASPPLTASSQVYLQVIDVNDNVPEFENEAYVVSIAENTPAGTSIVKVHANDRDEGKNAEIRYSINDESSNDDLFSIDASSGWITNLVSLDREIRSSYKLTVTATDNGKPAFNSTTIVNVNLVDSNDNPSTFTRDTYTASVKEDALAGTVIVKLELTDADDEVPSTIAFYIVDGDPLAQFSVRNTGEVYVSKAIDRETTDAYRLNIVATEGKFVSNATLVIDVLDVNDEPPLCLKYRYYRTLSEATVPGTPVLSIEAADADLEPRYKFYLTGRGAESFSLENNLGEMRVARALDREEQSRYELTAHVRDLDRTELECVSRIVIVVEDVNDNAPLFVTPYGTNATILEDAEIGTLVTKMHATDVDIGINRKIRYYMVDSAKEHFKIAAETGIVTLAKHLDREIRDTYNLTVKATDQGSPQLSSISSLVVMVLDVNDNPPEFITRTYYASIPESSNIGTEILQVFATSLDTGLNAEIVYSIIGGNEYEKFIIDSNTGVITLGQNLDYEKVKDYLLTIQATDRGTPPLSNQATVNVTIIDSNDNTPIFGQLSYTASISEDITLGDIVTKVTANDLDSGTNGKVVYSLERGDKHQQFTVDENTGHITVVRPLDRELISSYTLQIRATDKGIPELSSLVLVKVEVNDVNDNPPLFTQSNYSCVVQEDKRPGWPVCRLNVTDADIAPNGAPFTFDIITTGHKVAFRIDADGTVKTASLLKSKIQEIYEMTVRVFDNGKPTLFSDANLSIKIVGESQYAPEIVPLTIWVGSYQDRWPGGELGRIHSSDRDQYDTLVYGLTKSDHGLFTVDEKTGALLSAKGLDTGRYLLNVSVSDGKFTSRTSVSVTVDTLDDDMLNDGISVRVRGITPHHFVVKQEKKLLHSLRSKLRKDVRLISIQEAPQGHLDLLLVVKGGLHGTDKVEMNRAFDAIGLTTITLPCGCVKDQGVCQQRLQFLPDQIQVIATDVVSFVAPAHLQQSYCACILGYSGNRCETKIPTECACPNDYQCVLENIISPSIYKCVAPPVVATSCDKNATCPPFGASTFYPLTVERIIGFGSALVFIVFLICLCILCRRCRRTHSSVPQEDKTTSVLNSEVKRNSKINNLEATQHSLRPASYAAATSNNDLYVTATQLNNLDMLRSYGSAGDELEHVPPDYVRNLNRAPNISKHKVTNADRKKLPKQNKISRQTLSCVEEAKLLGGYHWDCSDWVRRSQNPLPNITEVPGSEVPDSSSSNSDESNEMNDLNNPAHSLDNLEEATFLSYRSDDDDVIHYGFPHSAGYPSQSDLSTNVCDIDDPETSNN